MKSLHAVALLFLATLLLCCGLTGCASTPEQKIASRRQHLQKIPFEQYPTYFAELRSKGVITEQQYHQNMQIWNQQREAFIAENRRAYEAQKKAWDSMTPYQRAQIIQNQQALAVQQQQMQLQRQQILQNSLQNIQQNNYQQQMLNQSRYGYGYPSTINVNVQRQTGVGYYGFPGMY